MLKKETLCILFIIFISAILRFYNLMHDSPYFFNPDERNMAGAITQFRLPAKFSQIPICLISQIRQITTDNCNLNPRFFAYGQFPLYLSYLSDQITKPLINLFIKQPTTYNPQLTTSFLSAIFWLRFYSALTSTLTVVLVYLITRIITSNYHFKFSVLSSQFSVLAALSAAFTPGLIQSAHFGTTESLLTFFFLASVYLSLRFFSFSRLSNLSYLGYLRNLLLLSLTVGLALGSKFTGIFFFVPPFLAIAIQIIKILKKKKRKRNWFVAPLLRQLADCFIVSLLLITISFFFFIISSPYNLIEKQDFLGAVFGYEADVATGKYEAFYTRQFINTTPILFQAEKIFPYALGWPIFILGSIGLLLTSLKLLSILILSIIFKVQISKFKVQIRKVKLYLDFKNLDLIWILIFGFWIYFIPNAFLFAKWTRFMVPIFPFFAIFAGYLLHQLTYQKTPLYGVLGGFNLVCCSGFSTKFKLPYLNHLVKFSRGGAGNRTPGTRIEKPAPHQVTPTTKFILTTLTLLSILPGIMFFSIYLHEDSRVTASRWIYKNIPDNSYVLSETANVVDIPLSLTSPQFPLLLGEGEGEVMVRNYQIISFDLYHLDENSVLFAQLLNHLEKADYIFIPSRRIFFNYPRFPEKFPLITKYYQLLFSGRLGFEKVAEISSFPTLSLKPPGRWPNGLLPGVRWEFPDESAEETFTVFDHPVIRIYQKVKPLTKEDYKKLFGK